MLFGDGASALVRLSDCLKIGLRSCAETSGRVLDLYRRHEEAFDAPREIARQAMNGHLSHEEANRRLTELTRKIPAGVAEEGAILQLRLHSESLSTILTACFCLESYVNSLSFHVLADKDVLGLLRGGHKETADVLLEAINQMSAQRKWEAIGRLKNGIGFDKSQAPLQDFVVLFRFRDDHVHDKVVEYNRNRPAKRYNNKLPDPVFGQLQLSHALFAARTYWGMVTRVHELLVTPAAEFQRHYNLAPWSSQADAGALVQLANEYKRVFPST